MSAIAFKGSDPTPFKDQAEPTFCGNVFGTVELTQKLIPLLQAAEDPIIVNVASQAGRLAIFPNDEKRSLLTNPNVTVEELFQLARNFVDDVKTGQHQKNNWPNSNYGTSKAFLIAFTRVFARDYPDIIVNACCPG